MAVTLKNCTCSFAPQLTWYSSRPLSTASSGISSSPLPPKLWPTLSSRTPRCSSWSKASSSDGWWQPHFTHPLCHKLFSLQLHWSAQISKPYSLEEAWANITQNKWPSTGFHWLIMVRSATKHLGVLSATGLYCNFWLSVCPHLSLFVSPSFAAACRRMLSGMKESFFLLKPWKPTLLYVLYGW